MELFFLGLGMGAVGGLLPTPLRFLALTQLTLKRRLRAAWILIGPPTLIDAVFLPVTYFFYQFIPLSVAHYTAYAGGAALIGFGVYMFWEHPRNSKEKDPYSWKLTYGSLTLATLVEAGAPATWVFWLTIAGPIIAEGRVNGYFHVLLFFAGSLLGYYGAAFLSVWLMAWGVGAHKRFRQILFLAANGLLVVLGALYIVQAYFAGLG